MLCVLRMRMVFVVVVLSFLLGVPVFGQMETATLSGVIQDPKGAVVPDVEVVATRIETGTVAATKTNGAGIYFFTSLMPGHYHLLIHRPGFKEIAIKEFELHVQDKLEQNFSLEIGSVSETVTVTASGFNVNTTDGSVGTVINREFVSQLPLNGRTFNTLLQLTPGVVIAPSNANNGQPGQFSIAGQRTDSNNFTIDGVSANFGAAPGVGGLSQSGTGSAQAFSALGGTSSLVSVDALQEFRIETSSFAPEFGRSPGGQVIITTRSGTNSFHGGAFDYFRNTVMDANDWFANAAGLPRAPEHHNDFGAFLGGPIWKDRTFFFFSYEGARLDVPQTGIDHVPSEYARSIAPPDLAPLLDAFPQPDDRTIVPGVYTASFTGSYANRGTLNATSIRIDHALSDRFAIFGRYNYSPSETIGRNVNLFTLSTLTSENVNTQTLTLGMSMVLNSRMSNTLRSNYSGQSSNLMYSIDSFGGAVPPSTTAFDGGLPAAATYATFFPFDANLLGDGPQGRNQTKQFNFVDDLAITSGTHQFKFGGDYRGIFLDVNPAHNTLSQTSADVQTFLSTGQVDLTAETAVPSHLLSQAFSLYGQDTWKITPRLAMTYGIRWELSPPPSARRGTKLASWENVKNPIEIALAPVGTPLWKTTYGNFAPRLGIAYRLDQDGTFIIRGGGGIFYDLAVGPSAELAGTFPTIAAAHFSGVSVPLDNVSQYLPLISLQPPFPIVAGIAPDLLLPRSYQWNVALERAFGQSQAISLTYLAQAGRKLFRNEALFQPNPNFTSEFLLTENDAWSNYSALQVQFRQTLSSRLQVLLNYSWSHSLDNASNDVVVGLSNTVISAARDYASSDFDIRHSFSGALAYSIPGASWKPISFLTRDWSVDTVIVARTGFPFNANVFGSSPNAIVLTRPDLVTGQSLWVNDPSAAGGKTLNPGAFLVPSAVRQGTEGRNDIRGFGFTQVDLSVARKFPLREALNLQFRADAFNLMNHPNFSNPLAFPQFGSLYLTSNQMLNQGLGGLNPIFQQGGPRSLQLSLKLLF